MYNNFFFKGVSNGIGKNSCSSCGSFTYRLFAPHAISFLKGVRKLKKFPNPLLISALMKTKFIVFFFFYINTIHASYLFTQFPALRNSIPHASLAQLPTPITHATALKKIFHHNALYIKHDDLTGTQNFYGGNKVRKLEFLLADALQKGAKKIITYGYTGSNHALATACYANKLGLESTLMLKPQPNSPVVRQNLLLDHHFGAQIILFPDNATRDAARTALMAQEPNSYFVPTGGSVPLGALGFVNAVFELQEQIRNGVLPEPNAIYVATGSCGTLAGLLLGLQLAQMNTVVHAVTVEPEETPGELSRTAQKLFTETNQLLHACSDAIPLFNFPEDQLRINKNFEGPAYGELIPETHDAMTFMLHHEQLHLDGTYSGKAAAALLADLANNVHTKDAVILFWNTYCGTDFSEITQEVDYKELPVELHHYFESTEK